MLLPYILAPHRLIKTMERTVAILNHSNRCMHYAHLARPPILRAPRLNATAADGAACLALGTVGSYSTALFPSFLPVPWASRAPLSPCGIGTVRHFMRRRVCPLSACAASESPASASPLPMTRDTRALTLPSFRVHMLCSVLQPLSCLRFVMHQ